MTRDSGIPLEVCSGVVQFFEFIHLYHTILHICYKIHIYVLSNYSQKNAFLPWFYAYVFLNNICVYCSVGLKLRV